MAPENCPAWLLHGKKTCASLSGRSSLPTLTLRIEEQYGVRSPGILGDFDSVIKTCGVYGTPGRGVRSRTVSPPPTTPTLLREESTHREEAQSHILLFVVFFIVFVCCVNCKLFMKKRGKIEAVYKKERHDDIIQRFGSSSIII